MARYFIELRTREYVKGYGFLSFRINICNKSSKMFLDTAMNTRLKDTKTVPKKWVHKTAVTAAKLIGNKTPVKIVKLNPTLDKNSRNFGEIIIQPEKKQEVLSKLRGVLLTGTPCNM